MTFCSTFLPGPAPCHQWRRLSLGPLRFILHFFPPETIPLLVPRAQISSFLHLPLSTLI